MDEGLRLGDDQFMTNATHESKHFSADQRAARGRAARAEVPRSAHAEWEPFLHRPDPVELLEEQAETRVPELVPIRYGRMLVSPFTYFRGAAYPMASDLSRQLAVGLVSVLVEKAVEGAHEGLVDLLDRVVVTQCVAH